MKSKVKRTDHIFPIYDNAGYIYIERREHSEGALDGFKQKA